MKSPGWSLLFCFLFSLSTMGQTAADLLLLNGKLWTVNEKQSEAAAAAIRAYTLGSAYASFDEMRKGSIEVGKLADFAVLSADILKINPIEIEKTRVVITIFDGKVIYERSK